MSIVTKNVLCVTIASRTLAMISSRDTGLSVAMFEKSPDLKIDVVIFLLRHRGKEPDDPWLFIEKMIFWKILRVSFIQDDLSRYTVSAR